MAAPAKDEKEKLAPIIVKKVIKKGGGHHGGAWKVAYADFVTAMMAFFLLLWLLNVTTKDQKNAISDYFDPSHPKVSDFSSGAGGVMGGRTVSSVGAQAEDVQPLVQSQERNSDTRGELSGIKSPDGAELDQSEEKLAAELRAKEDARFEKAADELKAEIAKSPELKDLQNNILIDITPEGLRIQIVDDKGRSMFPSGSAVMYDFMRQILLKISGVIKALPNQASVRGHTDSNKYKDPRNYDNWNLSADRAQASRRVLVTGGLPESRIENVMGRSDREPLEKDPAAARNRRISIILMRERLTKEALDKQKAEDAKAEAEKKALEAQKAPPVTIIDDTQQGPPKPADSKAVGKDGKPADPKEYNQPEFTTPLPTTVRPETIKRQPQVMYFGEQGAAKGEDSAPLYEGPTVEPIHRDNKPPQIVTPLFRLEDKPAAPAAAAPVHAAPAHEPAPVVVAPPAATPAQKTLTFGDAVPVQAPPLVRAPLPPAPALTLDNSKSGPAPAPPVVPTTPSGQTGNTSIVPNILPAVPAAPQTGGPAVRVPDAAPAKGKSLEF